ncbi:MAG: hypothetical protein PHV34_20125 [Verrucomicrobiae bacterium]|nr:hypothetical protein [Verrucomicrobiae bacterium]
MISRRDARLRPQDFGAAASARRLAMACQAAARQTPVGERRLVEPGRIPAQGLFASFEPLKFWTENAENN